jgi:hypothetical protein
MIKVICDNILNHKTDYIMHQTNCLARKVHPSNTHIATQIFRKYPNSNIYKLRKKNSIPGTIVVIGKVINMMAQKYPGKAYWVGGKEERIKYFTKCLEELKIHFFYHKNVSIGFPYRIGCRLAGGNWEKYSKILDNFNKIRISL